MRPALHVADGILAARRQRSPIVDRVHECSQLVVVGGAGS